MANENSLLRGIYIVEKKYDLIWLKDTSNDSILTLPYFKFENILFQSFDADRIKRILEKINCFEKVLIDFDKGTAKLVVNKEKPFIHALSAYFSPVNIEADLNNQKDISELLYKPNI